MTDTAEIKRTMRDYCKQLYANKIDNQEEMDKFLEKHNLLRLKQEKIENINRPSTSTEIDTLIKNLPTRRTTILQPVEQKPHSQKDRQHEKA